MSPSLGDNATSQLDVGCLRGRGRDEEKEEQAQTRGSRSLEGTNHQWVRVCLWPWSFKVQVLARGNELGS